MDQPNRARKLGAPVIKRPALVDYALQSMMLQSQMDSYSMNPNPQVQESLAVFYNKRPLTPVNPNQATDPSQFLYYPPRLPKAWDLSLVNFQRPGPSNMGHIDPFF
jgi:hypothetical protein